MAIQLIPVSSRFHDYNGEITLGGVRYNLRFYWNSREFAWYLDLTDTSKVPVLSGIKIVLGTFLGRIAGVPPFTTGVLAAVDVTNSQVDAGVADFGTRVRLYYVPDVDLMANTKEHYVRLGLIEDDPQ